MLSSLDIIDASFDLYRSRFRRFVFPLLLVLVPGAVLTFSEQAIGPSRGIVATATTVLLYVILLIASVFASIMLVHTADDALHQKTASSAELVAAAGRVFFPTLGTTLLVGIISLAGFILLIIPGVIVSVWYAFATLHTIFKGTSPVAALKASRELVRGRFKYVVWRLLAPNVFWRLAAWVIGFLIAVIIDRLTNFPVATNRIVVASIGLMTETLTLPLVVSSLVILFLDLNAPKSQVPNLPAGQAGP